PRDEPRAVDDRPSPVSRRQRATLRRWRARARESPAGLRLFLLLLGLRRIRRGASGLGRRGLGLRGLGGGGGLLVLAARGEREGRADDQGRCEREDLLHGAHTTGGRPAGWAGAPRSDAPDP